MSILIKCNPFPIVSSSLETWELVAAVTSSSLSLQINDGGLEIGDIEDGEVLNSKSGDCEEDGYTFFKDVLMSQNLH